MYDTIIIGAGLSGLAAGIRLAYYEQRVCIVERHSTIGGLNSFYRLRGRNYDVGLHAVTNFAPPGTKKGPLARLLRQLRMKWDDFAPGPADRARRSPFPRRDAQLSQRFRILPLRSPAGLSRRSRQLPTPGRQAVGLRRPGQPLGRAIGASGGGRDDSRSTAGRDAVLPADVLRRGLRARHGFSAISRSCSAASFSRAWPGRWPASD